MTGEEEKKEKKEKKVEERDLTEIHSESVIKFDIPSWAGKPPSGYHLDVLKGTKLIQKLIIDEKRSYYFGRNPKLCDFAIDHQSCSRVHAVLIYHKYLKRAFLVDLGSTHGTYIGKVLLEGGKPEQLQTEQIFHFGASTRRYMLREKSSVAGYGDDKESLEMKAKTKASARLLGLPEKEEELDNLTEYNTALNRRIATITGPEEDIKPMRKRKTANVFFNDDEDVINPEDVDPTVGRFRNLVHTTVIPNKRQRVSSEEENESHTGVHEAGGQRLKTHAANPHRGTSQLAGFGPISAKLGLSLPNPAPDVDLYAPTAAIPPVGAYLGRRDEGMVAETAAEADEFYPRKKIYAKEAWPGKKPAPHLLV